jgi:hypothetical protein
LASGGQSATEKVSATKRRSKRLDTQAKEEIHASEKIGAARASEVDRLMALARGLGPRSLAARDGVARQTKSEAKKLQRQSLWAAPAREEPGKQRTTSAHKGPKHHTSDP